ncbi:MAG: lytic transglycosylase domain-containing protein [Candidatus Eisenbacteria bacterium]|uniref:Lytic transglycosylase domain-containing protein n=1 Tax=Eiseniibacteriota bacterium TaxID=2212470 RepID=A0A948RSQ7_UNCEI|nr:lytic transglycosylase domain-containing protein [Candidatus Eisenbacteria bacterium]MBU1948230.1 lytic transglycosylase domain-containing protein [Candidatus Eisenbacteria bacterium]MBU2690305.1 lytic transglycosylase domain-containing protein [Candidatus Eisenbacteria bacterium]
MTPLRFEKSFRAPRAGIPAVFIILFFLLSFPGLAAAVGSTDPGDWSWEDLGEELSRDWLDAFNKVRVMDARGLVERGQRRHLREESLWNEIQADLLNHPVLSGRDSILYILTATSPAAFLSLLTAPDLLFTARQWDPRGLLAVPMAAWLLKEDRPDEALELLQQRVVPPEDRAYLDLLLVEVGDARRDSSGAGAIALRLANGKPRHPLWSDFAIRGAYQLFYHGQYEAAWTLLDRRRHKTGNETIRTLWLRWRIRKWAPQLLTDSKSKEILVALAKEDCNSHQINILCDTLERWLEDDWIPEREDREALVQLLLKGNRPLTLHRFLGLDAPADSSRNGVETALAVNHWAQTGSLDRALAWADEFLLAPNLIQKERVLLARARIHRRRGRLDEMSQDAWEIWESTQDPVYAGLALWELARETEDILGPHGALPIYRTLAGRSGSGRWARRGAVRVGVLWLAMGKAESALAWWDSLGLGLGGSEMRRPGEPALIKLEEEPERLAAGLYWRGRAYEEMGLKEEAVKTWQRIVRPEISGYHGCLATRAVRSLRERGSSQTLWDEWDLEVRNDKTAWSPSTWANAVLEPGPGPDDPKFWVGRAARWGIWNELRRSAWVAGERARTSWESLSGEIQSALLYISGEEFQGLRTAQRIGHDERRIRLSYPLLYAALLIDRPLSPFFLWAIMRQESAMDRFAVSRAGAVGLLQLMPTVAVEVGRRWGLPSGPLTRPECNIPLGVAHLLEAFEADLAIPEALAAYNAGLGPSRRWKAEVDGLDFYVERIGYGETRDYVRRVLRDHDLYRSLCHPEP